MSYIPPKCIQEQSLSLIQVPLSRAELNNQSAYHLADAQYAAGVTASSNHQKSLSFSKDNTKNTFSRFSHHKDISPGKTFHTAQQRAEYQTITSVNRVIQQSFTRGGSAQKANFQPDLLGGSSTKDFAAFNRSQSNQTLGPQVSTDRVRQTNSQSRGKARVGSSRGLPQQLQ